MKKHLTPARRAAWLSFAAPALLATPAFAQEAPTPPPPVSVTVPQAAPPAAAPAAPAPATTTESRTTIAPGAADVVDDARIEAAREARATPARRTARPTPARAAPVRAAPAQATTSAPVTAAQAPAAPAPAAAEVAPTPAPVADAPAETAATTTTTTAEDSGAPLWPIALIAALILAVGAFFLMRSRRSDADDDVYVEEAQYEAEPAYVAPAEPAYVAPVAAAAVVGTSDEATVTDAPAEDVAALTDGAAPVRNRPWLEFAMRPVRAGTSADEALVEIELTVANSGNVEARDVRVSTFMLTDARASEMERMMVAAPADAAIEPVSIAPGEGTRIDATLAALKSELGSDGRFNPVVVAEARYRLADGTEGRTSASFVVGVSDADGGAMTGIDLADHVMRDDVEAQLHGEVEHA